MVKRVAPGGSVIVWVFQTKSSQEYQALAGAFQIENFERCCSVWRNLSDIILAAQFNHCNPLNFIAVENQIQRLISCRSLNCCHFNCKDKEFKLYRVFKNLTRENFNWEDLIWVSIKFACKRSASHWCFGCCSGFLIEERETSEETTKVALLISWYLAISSQSLFDWRPSKNHKNGRTSNQRRSFES